MTYREQLQEPRKKLETIWDLQQHTGEMCEKKNKIARTEEKQKVANRRWAMSH